MTKKTIDAHPCTRMNMSHGVINVRALARDTSSKNKRSMHQSMQSSVQYDDMTLRVLKKCMKIGKDRDRSRRGERGILKGII
jgi:hypothetical protein